MTITAFSGPSGRSQGRREPLTLNVEGYKAIRNAMRLSVAPLTVIAGANSSGKSSFMQPFLMMKQTLDSAFDPGPLLLYGPNVKITDRTQMMSRGKARTDVVDSFTAAMSLGQQSRSITFSAVGQDILIERDVSTLREEVLELQQPLSRNAQRALRRRYEEFADRYVGVFDSEQEKITRWSLQTSRDRCFLRLTLQLERKDGNLGLTLGDDLSSSQVWVDLLRGIIHVPGLRGNPERAYSRSAVGATYPGTFETYVASIVYQWTERDDARLGALSSQLERLGLTWKLKARRVDDASIELLVGRTQKAQQGGANDLVSVADVGFGVSQTLPVLVALLAARPGQIVYLEQPEIHLHPRAQLALADVLVQAAQRGVRVVTETHSSLLIRGIQTAVAKGELRATDLSFNWFSRDAVSGFQQIVTAEIDKQGRFGDWPVDFDDVGRDADWEYLDAVSENPGSDDR